MFYAYTRLKDQVSVYRTIGPLDKSLPRMGQILFPRVWVQGQYFFQCLFIHRTDASFAFKESTIKADAKLVRNGRPSTII